MATDTPPPVLPLEEEAGASNATLFSSSDSLVSFIDMGVLQLEARINPAITWNSTNILILQDGGVLDENFLLALTPDIPPNIQQLTALYQANIVNFQIGVAPEAGTNSQFLGWFRDNNDLLNPEEMRAAVERIPSYADVVAFDEFKRLAKETIDLYEAELSRSAVDDLAQLIILIFSQLDLLRWILLVAALLYTLWAQSGLGDQLTRDIQRAFKEWEELLKNLSLAEESVLPDYTPEGRRLTKDAKGDLEKRDIDPGKVDDVIDNPTDEKEQADGLRVYLKKELDGTWTVVIVKEIPDEHGYKPYEDVVSVIDQLDNDELPGLAKKYGWEDTGQGEAE